MGNLGFQEILLIAVVILVLFGGRKIPEFMRGLGKGIREFNDAKSNVKKELEEGVVVFHAATKLGEHGKVVTSGGRVLAVTAVGAQTPGAWAAPG